MTLWYLYRTSEEDGVAGTMKPMLHNVSQATLKTEARRRALSEGFRDLSWLSGTDSNPKMEFPLELWADHKCLFVIRSW